MILINGTEILTITDGVSWSGGKDTIPRSLAFDFVYNPQVKDMPSYKCAIGDKVEFKENEKTLFLGYIEDLTYNTDNDTISVTCFDLSSRLARSKFIGRMRGTLTEIANKICNSFNIKSGIETSSTHVHNIVSTGDLTYFEVLKTACESEFDRFCLFMEADTLKLANNNIVAEFEIKKNIRSSNYSQSMSDMVTKVLVIDNDGNVLNSVANKENLDKFGLFQEVYNYNKDIADNIAEAKKLLKGIQQEATIVVDNNNACISGAHIKVKEPINNFVGIFEIIKDSHTIEANSVMTLDIEFVREFNE